MFLCLIQLTSPQFSSASNAAAVQARTMRSFTAVAWCALAVLVVVITLGQQLVAGAPIVLGGTDGWTNKANVDYDKWLSTYKIKVGDSLSFCNLDTTDHTAVICDKEAYDTCGKSGQKSAPTTISPTYCNTFDNVAGPARNNVSLKNVVSLEVPPHNVGCLVLCRSVPMLGLLRMIDGLVLDLTFTGTFSVENIVSLNFYTFVVSGDVYVICDIPTHCIQGMKVYIQVLNKDGSVNTTANQAPSKSSVDPMPGFSWTSHLVIVLVSTFSLMAAAAFI